MINESAINEFAINDESDGVGSTRLYFEQTIFDTGEARADYTIIVAYIGEASVSFTQTVFDAGAPTVDFAIRVLHGGEASVHFLQRVFIEGSHRVWFKQTVIDPGEASVDFEINVVYGIGEASVSFEQTIFDTDEDTGGAQVYFTQAVVDASLPASLSAPSWSLRVIVTRNDSTVEDITDKLLGSLSVEAEESSARVATIHFEPSLNYDTNARLYEYIGANVSVDCVLTDGDAATSSVYRIFTGEVDSPEYDVLTDVLTLICTDNLQETFELRTKEQIDAMLPMGFWTIHLFAETESMWEYAKDRMSTMPYSVDLGVFGSALRITPWDTESTSPNFTLTDDLIDDGSLSIELAGKRDLRNSMNVEAEFRYERLKLRKRNLAWDYGRDWCDYLKKSFPLPSKDMITQAVEGTGWPVESIWFDVRPVSNTFSCPDGYRIWVNATPKADEQYCVGFLAQLQKRWSQTITERFFAEVAAQQSKSVIGEVSYESTLSVQVDSDTSDWDQSLDTDEEMGTFTPRLRINLTGDDATTNPFEIPSDAYQQANGDWVVDWDTYPSDGNWGEFEYAFEAMYNQSRTEMRAAHRENYVRASLPVSPLIDTIHTLFIDTTRVKAKGKASKVAHVFDIETGEATTEVVVAVSIGFGGSNTEVPFEMPDRPDTDMSSLAESPPTPPHLTQIGGEEDSTEFIEAVNGYSTNYESYFGTDPTLPEDRYYPTRFQASTPEIEEEATAPIDAQTDESQRKVYRVYIPNDLFRLYSYTEV